MPEDESNGGERPPTRSRNEIHQKSPAKNYMKYEAKKDSWKDLESPTNYVPNDEIERSKYASESHVGEDVKNESYMGKPLIVSKSYMDNDEKSELENVSKSYLGKSMNVSKSRIENDGNNDLEDVPESYLENDVKSD